VPPLADQPRQRAAHVAISDDRQFQLRRVRRKAQKSFYSGRLRTIFNPARLFQHLDLPSAVQRALRLAS
jgi:hypothetical protein